MGRSGGVKGSVEEWWGEWEWCEKGWGEGSNRWSGGVMGVERWSGEEG